MERHSSSFFVQVDVRRHWKIFFAVARVDWRKKKVVENKSFRKWRPFSTDYIAASNIDDTAASLTIADTLALTHAHLAQRQNQWQLKWARRKTFSVVVARAECLCLLFGPLCMPLNDSSSSAHSRERKAHQGELCYCMYSKNSNSESKRKSSKMCLLRLAET